MMLIREDVLALSVMCHPQFWICYSYRTKLGFLLPAAPKRQGLQAEAAEKGKTVFIQMLQVGENGRLLSQSPSSPENPRKKLVSLSPTRTEGNVQSSCSQRTVF